MLPRAALFLALSFFCCARGVLAQTEKPAAPAADSKTDAAALTADFSKKYGEWKQMIAKLYQIKDRYRSDASANKKDLEAEYAGILTKAQKLAEPLSAAAQKAYAAAPNQNQDVTDFLIADLTGYVAADDFERAAKVARLLVDNGCDHQDLNLLAGMAFFGTNDFDEAGKQLALAKKSGRTNQMGERFLEQIPYYKSLWEKEKAIRAAEDKADDLPKVKLSTTKGDIVILLFENEAPIATSNFINLVEKKFYDDKTFHRVLPGFMAQGGDPKGDGSGGPGYTIPCECYQENHRNHFRGSLSMAHAGKDTGGSQFFLTFLPTSHLDGKHTVFGRVIEGFNVLAELQRIEPGAPGTPDRIEKATVLRKRPHKYDKFELLKKPDRRG